VSDELPRGGVPTNRTNAFLPWAWPCDDVEDDASAVTVGSEATALRREEIEAERRYTTGAPSGTSCFT
jgi:hypothetical protein